MTLASELYTRLSTDTDITNLVGTQIYQDEVEENATFPYIAFGMAYVINPEDENISNSTSLLRYDYAVECYTLHAKDGNVLADLIRARLHGWTSANVQSCWWQDQLNASGDEGFSRRLNFVIWYVE